jgi:uncharacterized membrane protein
MSKNKKLLTKISIIAILTALCFAGTYVQIKMPSGDMIHLGNFVMIIAALLLGGLEGGFVGSFGMGLYDVIYYTQKPTTIFRTLILKFLIGFIVGSLFRLIIKKDLKARPILFTISGLLFALGIGAIILYATGDFANTSAKNLFSSVHYYVLDDKTKSFNVSIIIPILSILYAITALVAGIISGKLTQRNKAALVAILVAIFINIIGEFVLRYTLEGWFVSDFNTSGLVATSKIPGSMITGFITVILSVIVYEPVYYALKKASLIEDDLETKQELEEENAEILTQNNFETKDNLVK